MSAKLLVNNSYIIEIYHVTSSQIHKMFFDLNHPHFEVFFQIVYVNTYNTSIAQMVLQTLLQELVMVALFIFNNKLQ